MSVIPNILFVDDEANILSALQRVFVSEPYNCMFASSGAEGIDLLSKHSINIIVSDMRMPEMDGAEFLTIAKEQYPDVTTILLTGHSDVNSTIQAINKGGISQYIGKPWNDNEIKNIVASELQIQKLRAERDNLLITVQKQNVELAELNQSLENKVKERTSELEQTMDMLDLSYDQLKSSYKAFVKVFRHVIYLRNPQRQEHISHIVELSKLMADEMELDSDECEQLNYAAQLHEIGKLSFNDDLLSVPFTKLSSKQKALFNRYPYLGQAALMSIQELHTCASIIRHHCEKWDGSGFPASLCGDDIPIASQILAVSIDFISLREGLMTGSPYSEDDALEVMGKFSGKRYNPVIIEAITNVIPKFSRKVNSKNDVMVQSKDLKPGMILSKDLYSKGNMLLLSEGIEISEMLIDKLVMFEKTEGTKFVLAVKPI